MSKHFTTKRKILELLKEKPMTRAELSKALNLAPATVSQHLEVLERSGAIFVDSNGNGRKWKYYKFNKAFKADISGGKKSYNTAAALGAAIVVVAAAVILSLSIHQYRQLQTNTSTNNVAGNVSQNQSAIVPGESFSSCPVELRDELFNSYIASYSGLKYYSDRGAQEYIIAPGATGSIVLRLSKPPSSKNISIANYAAMYFSINGSAGVKYAINSTNGVLISFNMTSEQLTTDSPDATVLVTIHASANAPDGTYTVIIPEGPCKPQAQSFLLTVGSKPYYGPSTAAITS
ncbi:MAG: winged helix-turn-helix domain-containing protein [Candidatus Micrarchaeaceae archaeon]